jgi:hypothetical protein
LAFCLFPKCVTRRPDLRPKSNFFDANHGREQLLIGDRLETGSHIRIWVAPNELAEDVGIEEIHSSNQFWRWRAWRLVSPFFDFVQDLENRVVVRKALWIEIFPPGIA